MQIKNPLVIVFEGDEGNIQTHLYPGEKSYQQYGILIAGIVRHVANAFHVRENDVWEWVDKERDHPTSPVTEIERN